MSFIDRDFGWFLLVAFVLWWLVRGRYALQLGVMVATSLFFYAHDHRWVLAVIFAYAFVDWGAGLWLERTQRRRAVLVLGVSFNLAVLCFWKYTPLLVKTLAGWLGKSDAAFSFAAPEGWVVPMGISFYAFAGIAYMNDVYHRHIPAERSFWRYLLFTAFFPHLVAGPILRAREFLWHLDPAHLPVRPLVPLEGTFLVARGFFKKLLLADCIAAAIDPFFANIAHPSTAGVWSLPYVWLYALQIYFDFSGYTDIARGLGLWFGFRWPENFHWPYLATSVQEFWRRWHMTLSRFLKDYLYIPLGGNRHGGVRAMVNLMVTMMLGGLWHGANWSFLIWGGLHGFFLVINRIWAGFALQRRLENLTGVARRVWLGLRVVLTFHAVCLAWCFFRLTALGESLACLRKAFVFDSGKMLAGGAADVSLWLVIFAYMLAAATAGSIVRGLPLDAVMQRVNARPFLRGAAWGGALSLLAVALLLAQRGEKATFIYFQF